MIYVDAHVHIYPCFDLEVLLDSAYENFSSVHQLEKRDGPFAGVLVVADTHSQDTFSHLLAGRGGRFAAGSWRFEKTQESTSLLAVNGDRRVSIIRGQQILSAEKLEVLCIAPGKTIEQGQPLKQLIDCCISENGIAVLPWGFGKWYGRRGRIVKNVVGSMAADTLFLGDNGGRPIVLFSSLLRNYEKCLSRRMISGSDPLPLGGEEKRAGSFGFSIPEMLDESHPSLQIKKILREPEFVISPYGRPLPIVHFFNLQISLRCKPFSSLWR